MTLMRWPAIPTRSGGSRPEFPGRTDPREPNSTPRPSPGPHVAVGGRPATINDQNAS